MLVTFRSTAMPDVLMLRELAQYLLCIVGKQMDTRGVIQHDELPRAIIQLEVAIADEVKAEIAWDALNYAAPVQRRDESGITQCASPLLDMMRHADFLHADIIWGY